MPSKKPLVLVPACNRMLGQHAFHVAGKKYVDFVRLAGCVPLVVPSAPSSEWPHLLDIADGVLLTGSASNVHPRHFDAAVHDSSLPLDEERDQWTLPMIRDTLARGLPLFGICRGAQETNVALGGSLHQAVQEVAGMADHRATTDVSAELQYGLAHAVRVVDGGVLSRIVGTDAFQVNSVHGQAVDRLADGLKVEARAPDGLVEAFSFVEGPGFNLCVQWHPEWQAVHNPQSVLLAKAFGQACREHQNRRRDLPP